MRVKRWLGKPKQRYVHIEPSAAVLKGIAAFFHSTNHYEIVFVSAKSNGISHSNSLKIRQSLAFLFCPKEDKPCYNPGGRSPPTPFRLITKKSKRRKCNEKNLFCKEKPKRHSGVD